MNLSTKRSYCVAAVVVAGVCAARCECLVHFDYNGLPCSADPTAPCLAGYYCDTSGGPPGVCRTGQAPDAGPGDGGPCNGACQSDQTCLPNRNVCVTSGKCDSVACPTGESCLPDAGLSCHSTPAYDLGSRCLSDVDCYNPNLVPPMGNPGSFCLLPSIYDLVTNVATQRAGFCTLPCPPGGGGCPKGSACASVASANHANLVDLCLAAPNGPTTNPLLLSPLQCGRDEDCQDFTSLTCVVFDDGRLSDAVSFCDSRVANPAASFGARCYPASSPLPVNGVCLPNGANIGTVGELCLTDSDCQSQTCLLAEFTTHAGIVRRIDACYSGVPSICQPCSGNNACSADAPHCIGDAGACATLCAGPTSQCASGSCTDAGFCACL